MKLVGMYLLLGNILSSAKKLSHSLKNYCLFYTIFSFVLVTQNLFL